MFDTTREPSGMRVKARKAQMLEHGLNKFTSAGRMGWQRNLPAVRAVWLLIAAQAIVAALSADVGRTNAGEEPNQKNSSFTYGLRGHQHNWKLLPSAATRRNRVPCPQVVRAVAMAERLRDIFCQESALLSCMSRE